MQKTNGVVAVQSHRVHRAGRPWSAIARAASVAAIVALAGCGKDYVTGSFAQSSPEDIQVVGVSSAFPRGFSARFTVRNNTSNPLGVSVCGDQLERRLLNLWVPVAGDVDCDLVLLQVPAHSTVETSYPIDVGLPVGVYRVRFSLRQLAGANTRADEYSTPFRVFEALDPRLP